MYVAQQRFEVLKCGFGAAQMAQRPPLSQKLEQNRQKAVHSTVKCSTVPTGSSTASTVILFRTKEMIFGNIRSLVLSITNPCNKSNAGVRAAG